MTPDMTAETRDAASLLREELARAEARVRELRESNAALERRLLRPTGLRTAALVTVAAGLILGTVAYRVAARLGEGRVARENDVAEKAHAVRMADQRLIADMCRLSSEKAKLDLQRCAQDRDALNELVRERAGQMTKRPAIDMPPCACQAGDPLCSCL